MQDFPLRFVPSHFSPDSIISFPQTGLFVHESVFILQDVESQDKSPPMKEAGSYDVQNFVRDPKSIPSHSSPDSMNPLPQRFEFMQEDVSISQALSHFMLPLMNALPSKSLHEVVLPFKFIPSHCSVPSTNPLPQRLASMHDAVFNLQSLPQANVPPLKYLL